jgi:hypothetical protein
MNDSKYVKALFISLAVVLSAVILGYAWVKSKAPRHTIAVTGSARKDFTADLIRWEARISRLAPDLKTANQLLAEDISFVKAFLAKWNLKEGTCGFTPIMARRKYKNTYKEGDLVSEEFIGFEVEQTLIVESPDIETVEKMIGQIGEIISRGIEFEAGDPEYFYTKLVDLKLSLLEKAAEDARARAQTIATTGGGRLGKLIDASMGVFQITAQNSNEPFEWSGTFNTKSKYKTAYITVRLAYELR